MSVLSSEPLAVDEVVELKTDQDTDTWVPARVANTADPKADGDEFRIGMQFLNEDLQPPGAPRG